MRRGATADAELAVGLDCGSARLHGIAARALAASGLEALPTDAGEWPPVVVCGWPALGIARQRQRVRETVERVRPSRVVVMTRLDDRTALARLVAEGAHGVVLEPVVETALAPTVRAVAAGQLCVPEQVRPAVERRPLSFREREVLALVIMGLSNAEIARRLHVAESTVKSHLVSTFAKLGVRSRAEAAEMVADPQRMLSTGIIGLAGSRADE
jgi:DNA-binding NarL/FixJ family response regulator